MFPAAKAQLELTMAWSELAMSTLSATTLIASAGAKVMAANAEIERIRRQPAMGPEALFAPWLSVLAPSPHPGLTDPSRFAEAATEATIAFWSTLLGAPPTRSAAPFWMPTFDFAPTRAAKPAPFAMPMWWTAFVGPALSVLQPPAPPSLPARRAPYLH